jgi:signal transduction histidine kinase
MRLWHDTTVHFRILNEKIEQLTQEVLNRGSTQAKLIEAVKIRDLFLSAVSHELRNPINALQLTLQGITRAFDGRRAPLSAEQLKQRLDRASNQVVRLARLVDKMLDVGRIASGRLEIQLEPLDLTQLAKEVVDRMNDEMPEPRIQLRCPEITIQGDRSRIDQVLSNLLDNAVKYAPSGQIDATVELDGDLLRLSVTDRGIGIAQQDQERIFERFERVSTGKREVGFGLGLWIVREIVSAMRGKVGLTSSPGQGSTFTVEMPFVRPETPA